MNMLHDFWTHIDHQLEDLTLANTVSEVLEICPQIPGMSSGDGFFEGSGGDGTVYGSLFEAGWVFTKYKAPYYWVMRSPDGSELLTYVEGDLYRGDTMMEES